MRPESRTYVEAVTSESRKWSGKVRIDFQSSRFDSVLAVKAQEADIASQPLQILDGFVSQDKRYWQLGMPFGEAGVFLWPQESSPDVGEWLRDSEHRRTGQCGYAGTVLSDDLGFLSSPETILVRHAAKPITSIFLAAPPENVLVDFDLELAFYEENWFFKEEVRGNDRAVFTLDIPRTDLARYMRLTIRRIGKPLAVPRLIEFSTAQIFELSDEEIVDWKTVVKKAEALDGTGIGGAFVTELTLKLFNSGRRYDFRNLSSPVYGAVKPYRKIEIFLGLETSPGVVEWTRQGVFWSKDWEVSEDGATAQTKALDTLSVLKEFPIASAVHTEISCFDAFSDLLSSAGFDLNFIDEELRRHIIPIYAIPQGANILTQLTTLCEAANAYAVPRSDGRGFSIFTIRTMLNRHEWILRFFSTRDWIKQSESSGRTPAPNEILVEYKTRILERGEVVAWNHFVDRETLPTRSYDPLLAARPEWAYRLGYGENPSLEGEVSVNPDYFLRFEVTDPIERGVFEWEWELIAPDRIRYRLWQFEEPLYGELTTLSVIEKARNPNILLQRQTETIPSQFEAMRTPAASGTVEERNAINPPHLVEFSASGDVVVSAVVAKNVFLPGLFEFCAKRTSQGVVFSVWNYSIQEQEFTFEVYGQRIEEKEGGTKIAKDSNRQDAEGVVSKRVSSSSFASTPELAQKTADLALFYYTVVGDSLTVEVWPDPRIEIGDELAVESLRGYAPRPFLVEEIVLTYGRGLKQSLTGKGFVAKDYSSGCFDDFLFYDTVLEA